MPISDKLRDLRQKDLNNLIKVSGVVTRRTAVFPQIKAIAYDCLNCSATLGPFQSSGTVDVYPEKCKNCELKGPFKVNPYKSEYGNFQKLTLQETPGSVPPGRVPRFNLFFIICFF
jgi:DNA replication licensing factor MCM2